jgi:hypothetical protein
LGLQLQQLFKYVKGRLASFSCPLFLQAGCILPILYKLVDRRAFIPWSLQQSDFHAMLQVAAGCGRWDVLDATLIILSYKRDAQDQQAKDLEEHLHHNHRSRRSRKSERMAEYYEQRIKEKKAELEDRRADLEDVKRQSYSDTRRHNESVRRYKRSVNDTKMEIERLQEKYRKTEGRWSAALCARKKGNKAVDRYGNNDKRSCMFVWRSASGWEAFSSYFLKLLGFSLFRHIWK